jgi:hypothetical protein
VEKLDKAPTEFQPQSKLPLIALVLSLSPLIFGGVSLVLFYGSSLYNLQYFNYGPVGIFAVCLSCVGVFAPLAGIICGGLSLARGYPQKTISIIAILAGILAMLIMVFVASFISIFAFASS